MKTLKFNHLAIWLSIFLSQAIPLVWYSIFSDRWMTLNNLTEEYIQANQNSWFFLISLLGSTIAIYVLAWLFIRLPIESARSGMITGLIIGAAFNITSLLTINMFSYRPLELVIIDGTANVIVYGIAGLILGGWRRYRTEPGHNPTPAAEERLKV